MWVNKLPYRVYGPDRERLIVRYKLCPVVWTEQLRQIRLVKSFYIYSRGIYLSVTLWPRRCEQQESCVHCKVIGLICLSLLMTMHIYLQSWAGVICLETQQHLSLCTKINLSLVAFLFPPALPIMSFLSLCQYLLFYSQSLLRRLLSHWQSFGKCCCCPVAFTGWYYVSYWHYVSYVFLASTSKCLPISLICPGLFWHDCSHWVFFHGMSGFPARISLVKFPLEPFWIPLMYQVYLWSAWCCNAHVKASHMCCKIH